MADLVKIFLDGTKHNAKDNLANGPNIFTNVSINSVHQHKNGDTNINALQLDVSGGDANSVALSLPPSSPSFPFSLTHSGDVWTIQYTGSAPNPNNATWALALESIQATDSSATPGKFRVTVDALDSSQNSISNNAHEAVTACFMAGTLVATPADPKKIEDLGVGDLVMTTEGYAAPIRWIGRQTVSRIFADPIRVLPIRVKANAIEEKVPSRDLLVSPDHALLIDGVLIQAGALVNGTSIVREETTPQVFVYYHIELSDHSLIYAEGAPAETFIDNVDRLGFDNWAEHDALYGDSVAITEMKYPRAKAARQVPQASKLRLAVRGADLYPYDRQEVA